MKTLNQIIADLNDAADTLRALTGDAPKAAPAPEAAKQTSAPAVLPEAAYAPNTPVNLRTNDGRLHFQVRKGGSYKKFLVVPTEDSYEAVRDSDASTRDSFAGSSTQYLRVENFGNVSGLIDALYKGDENFVNEWIEERITY